MFKDNDVYIYYPTGHCKSGIAICQDGALWDTYWDRDRSQVNTAEVTLTLLGNLDDFHVLTNDNPDYYLSSDILDLNHRNSSSGNLYRRNGAQRNKDRMLDAMLIKYSDLVSQRRSLDDKMLDLRQNIEKVKNGDLDIV